MILIEKVLFSQTMFSKLKILLSLNFNSKNSTNYKKKLKNFRILCIKQEVLYKRKSKAEKLKIEKKMLPRHCLKKTSVRKKRLNKLKSLKKLTPLIILIILKIDPSNKQTKVWKMFKNFLRNLSKRVERNKLQNHVQEKDQDKNPSKLKRVIKE